MAKSATAPRLVKADILGKAKGKQRHRVPFLRLLREMDAEVPPESHASNIDSPKNEARQKASGAYYTPDHVARTLLNWAVRNRFDRMLDPSCGDGRFLALHYNSVGIEQDRGAAASAMLRAPRAVIHQGDFFAWAAATHERFECAAGNPPFIRYQTFSRDLRERAVAVCRRVGADFSGLSSSWAPFIVATATLLKPGGRLAFVVPAEIGHAPYAAPLIEYLVNHFGTVQIIAIRNKIFPELSTDCWLLYAEQFGARTQTIRFSAIEKFQATQRPPREFAEVDVTEWRNAWNKRLRPFLISKSAREAYRRITSEPTTRRFGDIALIGIGYVSGDNEFFHLRPSEADRRGIPTRFLYPTVRNGRMLPKSKLTKAAVDRWIKNDDPILLLRLSPTDDLSDELRRYLGSERARKAREAYKCRVRDPWYAVPDIQIPDFFLSYMSGLQPILVRNDAACTCTNSVHSVRLKPRAQRAHMESWNTDFVRLSCELEGHPLGGGMLKLEPREATQIVLPPLRALKQVESRVLREAVVSLRSWRHYAASD